MSQRYLQEQILDRIRNQQWKSVKDLLSSEKYWEEVRGNPLKLPGTLLHLACSIPSVPRDVISMLLHVYPHAVSLEDEDGNLPIHLLCEVSVRPDIINLLLSAYPESSFRPSLQQQELPFYILVNHCIQNYDLNAAFSLISAIPASLIYNQEVSVLHQIGNSTMQDIESFEKICLKVIEMFPHICKLCKDGNSLLHTMCSHKDSTSRLIGRIISLCPESCAVRDSSGNLPLHIVNSEHQSVDIIRMLVKCYPSGLLVQNARGQMPLVAPMIRNSPTRVKELLRFCTDNDEVRNCMLYARDPFGMDTIRYYFYAFQRQVSQHVAHGSISIDDISSYGKVKKYTKLIANELESLFHVMRVAANNDVDYEWNTPHQDLFWTSFPIFTKTLFHHSPDLASHKDCFGNMPLHVIARHHFHGSKSIHCSFCSTEVKGTHLWFQGHTYACKDCMKRNTCTSKHLMSTSRIPLVEYQGFELMKDVIAANPSAANVKDVDGSYPLHSSLRSGKSWAKGVKELALAAPATVSAMDKVTSMLPFMLAAERKGWDTTFSRGEKLTTVFELLRAEPSQVQ